MAGNTKILQIEGIGQLRVVKSRRSKRISIRVKPFEDVRVTIPYYSSFSSALAVVESHKDWILKQREKIDKVEQTMTTFDETTQFTTKRHQLKISRISGDIASFVLKDGLIKVEIPSFIEMSGETAQGFIRKAIERALFKEGYEYLPHRLKSIADEAGMSYKDVKIKQYKTRWGSCTHDNVIILNIHLMRLPEHLSDLIIKHELAHTLEKNHGKGFYSVLQGLCASHRELNRELKNYSIHIY